MHGVFVSYGRNDDEPFVERLYADLARHGIALWRDREAMRSRGRSFVQEIQDGIADFDRLLLVVGPYALDSAYCRMEWEFALDTCRIVVPLFRKAGAELLPPALRSLHGYDFRQDEGYDKSLNALLADLREPVPPPALLHDVDPLPPFYLARPAPLAELSDALTADAPEAAAAARSPVMVLHGMPGCGKSSMAAALARSCPVRRRFPGGVFWFPLGQERERPELAALRAGQAGGPVLVVLDDVWRKGQVEPLLKLSTARDRLLLTTRHAGLATALGAQSRLLDVLDDEAALELLARWSETPAERLDAVAVEVARECGNLPLSLAMVGALVGAGASTWSGVLAQLRAMQVSVDALSADERERYLALAVFPEDRPFPATALAPLWGWHDPEDPHIGRQAAQFVGRSLLRRDAAGLFSLHDLHHDYLRAVAGDTLPQLHGRLLDAYRRRCGADWFDLPADDYMPDRLAYHLAAAGRLDELQELFDRESPGPRSAWQELRSGRDPSGGAFRADLTEWWRAVERVDADRLRAGEPPDRLAVELRCALAAASLTARMARVEPELLYALGASGVWPVEAAESAAWQMPDAEAIASALQALAPLLDVEAISKAFRWYLHAPHASFSAWVLMAFAKRLAELGVIDRAAALARQARTRVRDKCQERVLLALLEAGNPEGALKALLSLPEPQRWGYICWTLAQRLPPQALPRLQAVTAKVADETHSPYRSWLEATLAQRYLELGETGLAEQCFAAVGADRPELRAECVQACAGRAPAHWVSETLKAVLASRSAEDWQILAALKALAGPALALGIEAPLLAAIEDSGRVRSWAARLPDRTAELLFAVGAHLAGSAGEHLRAVAAALLARVSAPEDRAAGMTEALDSDAERHEHAERLCNWCADHGRAERAMVLAGRLDRPGGRLRFRLLRAMASFAPPDRLDALATVIPTLDEDSDRAIVAGALAERLIAESRTEEAIGLVAQLAPERRRNAWKRLLPLLPRARARLIAGELMQELATIGDAAGAQSMQRRIAGLLARRGSLPLAIKVLAGLPDEAARFSAYAFLAEQATEAGRATLRALAEPLGERLESGAGRSPHSIPLAWSRLGLPERALAALERFDEGRERDWQRGRLVSDPGSPFSLDQVLDLARSIGDEALRLQAWLALWARHPDRREAVAAAMAGEPWVALWASAGGRLSLAAWAACGFGEPDPAKLNEELPKACSELLEGLSVLMHANEQQLALLAPHVDADLAGDAVLAFLDEGALPPEPASRREALLAWFCRRLSREVSDELRVRLRAQRLRGDERMQSLARAQVLGVLALNGPLPEPSALVEEVIAYAADVDDEFWAREPLYRIFPLLPARLRAELSARAAYFLLQAMRTEADPAVWQFGAERLTAALLGLAAPALHEAWRNLLRELSARDRKLFWRVTDLLIAMVDKLGGDAALLACARELARVPRLWP